MWNTAVSKVFNCDCGYYQNDHAVSETCQMKGETIKDNEYIQDLQKCKEERKKEEEKEMGFKSTASDSQTEGRIVNGYEVERECMKRPWIVLIK